MPAPKGFKTIKKLMKRGQARRTCAKGSYGLTKERKGVRTLVCCLKRSYNRKTGRCRTATKGVEVFRRKR